MGFISDENFSRVTTLPVGTPQTELTPASVLPIAHVRLHEGQVMRVRWMSLLVPKINYIGASFERVSDFYESVYVGLFSGNVDDSLRVGGMPLFWVGIDGVGYAETNFGRFLSFSNPGQYTLALVNNTTLYNFDAVVTGAFRIY